MSYENSLTSSVNDYVSGVLAKKLAAARHRQAAVLAAKSVREYLDDPETLLTSDFVLRRHIQAHHPDLLPGGMEIPDLVNGCNRPWEPAVIDHVATLLFKSQGKELGITKKNWQDYLTGKSIRKREKLMKVAFILRMDVDTTLDLMLAVDAEPYNVRNPLDFICMFCQQEPGLFTWAEAMQMLEDFRSQAGTGDSSAHRTTPGMSEELKNGLQDIFESYLGQTQSRKALVAYMVANAAQFSEAPISHTRMAGVLELAGALKILYPFYWVANNEHKDGKIKRYGQEVSLNGTDGYPVLNDLLSAIFQQNGWEEIHWGEKKEEDKKFFELWSAFRERMMAIERLRSGGRNVRQPERQDVLLLIYFFITGYRYLVEAYAAEPDKGETVYCKEGENIVRKFFPSPAERLQQLNQLQTTSASFGLSYTYALRRLKRVYQNPDNSGAQLERLTQVVDLFLTELGFRELYLPARIDRIVMLALLSGEPEEMLPMLLSRMQLEDMESER